MTISHIANPLKSRTAGREAVHAEIDSLFRLDGEDVGELLLIRHAEPAHGENAGADPLLSCAGLDQAERLADRLRSLWLEAIYTAPERRAAQTAHVLQSVIDRPLFVLNGLADIEFDATQVRETSWNEHTFRERFTADPRWDSLPGFGSSKTFRRRAVQAVEGAIACNAARRVAVITHTAVINAYLSMILAVPRDQFFAPDYTSISVVRWREDSYGVRALNDTSHLGYGGELPTEIVKKGS
jgi:broad specificity phosphatase PhoE